MLEFSARYRVPPRDEPRHQTERALSRVPTSLLAHELTHVTHTLGTAAGLRCYLLGVEGFTTKMDLIAAATEAAGSKELDVPLIANAAKYQHSDEFTRTLLHLGGLLVTTTVYAGGIRAPETDPTINIAWIEPPRKLLGFDLGWETAHTYLGIHTAQEESVMCGYRHLTEGVAKVVERTQRRIAGEPGEQSPYGPQSAVPPEEYARVRSSPFDPYYVAAAVFNFAKSTDAQGSPVPAYEDYVAILSDLAMMFDPVVTPRSFAELFRLNDGDVDRALTGYSPFALFLRLCRTFWQHVDDLPLLEPGDRNLTSQVLDLQNAILRLAGTDWTMEAVTREALESSRQFAEVLSSHLFTDAKSVKEVFTRGFEAVLTWRLEILHGAAIYEDLLTDRTKLLELSQRWSPSFAVGSDLYSSFDVTPGQGIAVEQTNLQVFGEVLTRVAFENGACPLRRARCALSPVPLCSHLPETLPTRSSEPYCVREQYLRAIRALGASQLRWTK